MTFVEKIQEFFDPMIADVRGPKKTVDGYMVIVSYDLATTKIAFFNRYAERNYYKTYRCPLDAAMRYKQAMDKKRARQEKNRSHWYER